MHGCISLAHLSVEEMETIKLKLHFNYASSHKTSSFRDSQKLPHIYIFKT